MGLETLGPLWLSGPPGRMFSHRVRVHVEVLPADWSLDGAGMAVVVSRLPKALRKMLSRGARAPRILFTDRGTGMYAQCGSPVREYADAVATHGFR